tara:strand:+ start:97 stop:501 length:405 start_codon:yes stop_codon:yes gene_type:complete
VLPIFRLVIVVDPAAAGKIVRVKAIRFVVELDGFPLRCSEAACGRGIRRCISVLETSGPVPMPQADDGVPRNFAILRAICPRNANHAVAGNGSAHDVANMHAAYTDIRSGFDAAKLANASVRSVHVCRPANRSK